jgi:hypothetical protein
LAQGGHVSIAEMLQELGFSGEAKLSRPSRTGATRYGWAAIQRGVNRRRPVQIVASAVFGTYLGKVAGPFEALAPPNALPALTKMPYHRHCEHHWQGAGIHRHAAGNVLHSLVSSRPIGPPPFFISDRKLQICLIFVATQGDLFEAAQLNVKRYMYK